MPNEILAVPHDLRHPAKDDPYARESVVYMAHIAELDATLAVYAWVTGEGKAGTSAVVMRAGQATVGEGTRQDELISPDADFDDFRLAGLHLQHLEADRTASVRWTGTKFSFALKFTAMHEPYAYGSAPQGCPVYLADDRVEQSGLVDVELTIDGETTRHSATGHRDHSWGARDWKMMQHYKWVEAQTPSSGVHVFEINALGQRTVYGYVFRDGQVADVTGAVFTPTFDRQRFVTALQIEIKDALGRTTHVSTTEQARTEIPVSPDAVLVDTTARVEIEGEIGGGWVDFAWPPEYLAHMRARA